MTDDHLRFADYLRHAVVQGHKDTTVRLPDAHGVVAGEVFDFVDPRDDVFAEGYIRTVATTTAHTAPAVMTNLNALHGADGVKGLVRALNEHYSEDVHAATPVDIIQFEVREVYLE